MPSRMNNQTPTDTTADFGSFTKTEDFSFFNTTEHSTPASSDFSFFQDETPSTLAPPPSSSSSLKSLPQTDDPEHSLDAFMNKVPDLPTYESIFDETDRDHELVPRQGEALMRIVLWEPLKCGTKIPDDQCAVCLTEFQPKTAVVEIPKCRHLFHKSCLSSWFARGSRTCPRCRSNLLK